MNTTHLPITYHLNQAYILTWTCAALMTGISLAGICLPNVIYPTDDLRLSFMSNDVVNLIVGLPFLLGSAISAKRGSFSGLLIWPGALLFIIYNYIAYAFAFSAPFMPQSILYLIPIVLSIYTIYLLLVRMDVAAIQNRLIGKVSDRLCAGVLIGLGGLFFLRCVLQLIGILAGQTVLSRPEIGVQIADLLITPLWIIGGILLWRKKAYGYATSAGLLFQASMLFIALLLYFLLLPILTEAPFPLADFLVILFAGLICFITAGLFMRGVFRKLI